MTESILSQPFLSLDAFDKLSVVAFYLTIVLAVIFIAAAFMVKRFKRESLPQYLKAAKSFALGYAVAFGTLMIVLTMAETVADGSFVPKLFWPVASVFIVAVALFVAGWVISATKSEFLPKFKFIALIIMLIPVIVSIVMLSSYYKTIAEYYEGSSQAGLYVSAVLLIFAICAAYVFLGKKGKLQFSTREMAYAAICIALAFALSYIRFFKMPQGGSITLVSMFPIMLFSYMFGIKKGVIVGAVYGLLQAIQDPWIIHPAQFLLDYPIAFAVLGFSGIFRELGYFKKKPMLSFATGAMLGGVLRYFVHVLSGIFAFASYGAAAGYAPVPWGFLYNTFTLVDTAIVVVVGVIIFGTRNFVKLVEEKSGAPAMTPHTEIVESASASVPTAEAMPEALPETEDGKQD